MASTSSHCWQGPVFFTISVVLAFLAINTALHSPSNHAAVTPTTTPISLQHSLHASAALRKYGFNFMANFLLISPEIFFASPNSTIFAIKDSAFTNTSLPLHLFKRLLQHHVSPLRLSMDDLLKKPQGCYFPTLVPGKNVALTKVVNTERRVEINHVLLSNPDMFLEEHIAVHGVLRPFSTLDTQDSYKRLDPIQASICDANSTPVLDANDPKNMVDWTRIVRVLSSNGFVSFAIGLNSVLQEILEHHRNLTSLTIFTPREFDFMVASSPILERILRFHILPQRLTYLELVSLPDKASLRTLLPENDLHVTENANETGRLAINRVEIVAPEILKFKKFIVHGISQAFTLDEFNNALR
ncbi:hypothetical protein K2173_018715 [Erythroxylum novogranatense]|uniref:FAS1 domain-containing protein n=1 Tax=Erythroxylum novogranatense TaxID=1862640 RepID=A0AAV8SB25_9ROSI|nr:hypothetical protein K2173_018715 [Erythroxylum novogranatense]